MLKMAPPTGISPWSDHVLKNLHWLLGPDLLYVLRRMGHGDEVALVDANFPAESHGRRLVRMDGVSATDALEAVISVLPLDTYTDCPVNTMQVVGDVRSVPDIALRFRDIVSRNSRHAIHFGTLEREAFYARSQEAFAIVATGERRLYGNVLLTKGVVGPSD